MKIVIVRSCLETLTPRAFKNAQALASEGYEVTLLAWDREAKNPESETKDGYQARRFRFRAPYGPKVLLYLPIWWLFEFFWLMKNHWDVVHAMDFDTVPPAMLAAKIKRKPIIYELADIYEDMTPLPQMLRRISIAIDKAFMRRANAMILVRELDEIPNTRKVIIHNSPPDLFQKINSLAKRAGEKDSAFTIFYAGAIYKSGHPNLDKAVMAIKNLDTVRLIIAGYGDQVEEIEEWAKARNNVEFIGRISYTEVLERTMNADLLVALYKPAGLVAAYSSSNKLFEAMMCGKPILVNTGTAMTETVQKENCGLVVDASNTAEIEKAIIRLQENPELCQQLGANGRRAYEERYSWEIMKQRLLALYRDIR